MDDKIWAIEKILKQTEAKYSLKMEADTDPLKRAYHQGMRDALKAVRQWLDDIDN